MMREFCLSLLGFAAIFGTTSHAADHQAVFSDGDFLVKDWTTLVYVRDDPNVGGTAPLFSLGSVTRQTTGGVLNSAYLRSIHMINPGEIINTVGISIDESYDPRQRAISTVDFSTMVNHFVTTGGTATGVMPALLQSGQLFIGPLLIFSGNQWVQRSASNLDADDFVSAVDFWSTGAVIRPDFSAFGDPIQFGYSLQNNLAFGATITEARGVDDWSVTINRAEMSDIHGDGVDGVDLDLWSAGFGTVGTAYLKDGDFNLDTNVDGADFLKWQRQFGSGIPPLLAVTTVPEPSSLNLFALLALAGGCFQRCQFRRASRH